MFLQSFPGQRRDVFDVEISDPVKKLRETLGRDTEAPIEAFASQGKLLVPDKTLEEQNVGIGSVLDGISVSPKTAEAKEAQPLRLLLPDSELTEPLSLFLVDDSSYTLPVFSHLLSSLILTITFLVTDILLQSLLYRSLM